MVDHKQIYVSFERENYKLNKEILLRSQIDMINLQKKLEHLNAVRANKKRMIKHLNAIVTKIHLAVDRLKTKLPEADLPHELRRKVVAKQIKQKKEIKEKKIQKEEEYVSGLDEELLNIQERLKRLG